MTTASVPSTPPDPNSSPEPDHGRDRSWREIIDGWVRTPAIRRDAIRVLTMVLVCILFALMLLTVSGQLAGLWHWVISTSPGRIVGGCVATTTFVGIGVKRIRRSRRAHAQTHQEEDDGAGEGNADTQDASPAPANGES
jgi:hypothetical protein